MIVGISAMLFFALSLVVFFLFSQRRLHREKTKAQEAELQHQQELLERNLIVQEEERQRIAAQLHDDIGSKLGVIHLTFHRLRRAAPRNEQFEETYKEIDDLINTAMQTTRKISHELIPPTLEDFGLITALEEFCEQVRGTGTLQIEFTHNLTRSELPTVKTALNLFRIIQEMTSNTLKYAAATQINIELQKTDDQLSLQYTDNGIGFEADQQQSSGLGLKNLRNRARIIGADYVINSTPGEGFSMRMTIPINQP